MSPPTRAAPTSHAAGARRAARSTTHSRGTTYAPTTSTTNGASGSAPHTSAIPVASRRQRQPARAPLREIALDPDEDERQPRHHLREDDVADALDHAGQVIVGVTLARDRHAQLVLL